MRTRSAPAFVDALLALALLGLTMATLLPGGLPGESRSDHVVALTLAVLAVLPVGLRQRAPIGTLLVVAAALAGYGLLGYGEWPSGAVGLVVAIFTVATLRRGTLALAMVPVVAIVIVLPKVTGSGITWPELFQALLVCGCAWAVGVGTRRWAQEAEAAAARGERLVAEERIRIARELHDVVAHHMSVVALQTGVAQFVLDTDVATARSAVATAGAASREALQEMGRLLDALRTDETPTGELAPQPGLQQLDELVARMREVGLDVTLRGEGPRRRLSAGAELCVFRVVQESLTNVLRHAGPGTDVQVTLSHADEGLMVTVQDSGRAEGARSAPARTVRELGSGRGIDGMRERAELYGGTLTAGPRAGGGFDVRLQMPEVARERVGS